MARLSDWMGGMAGLPPPPLDPLVQSIGYIVGRHLTDCVFGLTLFCYVKEPDASAYKAGLGCNGTVRHNYFQMMS